MSSDRLPNGPAFGSFPGVHKTVDVKTSNKVEECCLHSAAPGLYNLSRDPQKLRPTADLYSAANRGETSIRSLVSHM